MTLPPARRWHRRLGLLLLLPFLGWAATGLVFFLKPGYAGAYAQLEPHFLPLAGSATLPVAPRPDWLETRSLRTVLGTHLLVRTATGHEHLHAESGERFAPPSLEDARRLVEEAVATDPTRYGSVSSARVGATPGSYELETATGVRITLDWGTLSLAQRGRDTDRIDALYRVHYLQWTGSRVIDRAIGFLGLAGLVALSLLGLRLALR
jgi:hypothetical protein